MKHFERINQLLDQICQRCQTIKACNSCVGCQIQFRKGHLTIPNTIRHETEIKALNQFLGVLA